MHNEGFQLFTGETLSGKLSPRQQGEPGGAWESILLLFLGPGASGGAWVESRALVSLPQRERALEGLADVSLEGSRVTTGHEWFFLPQNAVLASFL